MKISTKDGLTDLERRVAVLTELLGVLGEPGQYTEEWQLRRDVVALARKLVKDPL